MKDSLKIEEIFTISPSLLYITWLSSDGHTNMTGGKAVVTDEEGKEYFAWDEYIQGVNKQLKKNELIVQTWRSTEFSESDEDSEVCIQLKGITSGCKLTLTHTNIPEGQGERYKKGWEEHYFKPMQEYFSKI